MEKIFRNDKIIALIIRSQLANEQTERLVFYTPEEFPLQFGIHSRQQGDFVVPHLHVPIEGIKDLQIQEIFYILSGKIKIDLYDDQQKISDVIVETGDTILLNAGHSVSFLENSKMIEIKQGPYRKSEKKEIK